jgi:NADH-quinone oxidoreductase subunit E
MAQITAVPQFDEGPLEFKDRLAEIFKEFEARPDDLIPVLQRVQAALGYLSEKALLEIAYKMALPSAKVFGVATFYAQFRLQPVGKHIIRVCRGTACHVRGSGRILKGIQVQLKVAPGSTTKDRLLTLETVACFGSCALAPVLVIDDAVHGRMNSSKAQKFLDQIRAEEREFTTDDSVKKRLGGQNGLCNHEGQGRQTI